MSPKNDDQPLFGREGLFRQKLNQLRTTGEIRRTSQYDPLQRVRELEQSQYLQQAQSTLNKSAPDELERVTMLDSLTEVYNHKTIVRILKDELKRSRRYKKNETILMLSIDRFDEIDAARGKLTSDSILKGVSNFLMKTIRDVDIPGRYDAQRFAVICPETDVAGVNVLANRIRDKIRFERVSEVGQNWNVTVSIGIASFPVHGSQAEELFKRAYQACEQVSLAGGDNTKVAD
ncbi:MAG TPA: GGDEF domain-containing protein [Candidatus Obscuribacterales bacterium]